MSRGLLEGLHKRGWEILHLAINYNDLEPVDLPWKMVPAGFYRPMGDGSFGADDPFGYLKIDKYVTSFDPDVALINNDFPVVNRYLGVKDKLTEFGKHRCKKVIYSPSDSYPFPRAFYDAARPFDEVVAYTYWQKDMMCVGELDRYQDMKVVYHGIDQETYFPIPKPEAKVMLTEVFQKYNKGRTIPDFSDAYIVYFVGTNQWRKDIPALFRGYMEFRKAFPDEKMFLIPHTNAAPMSPAHGGWSLYNLRELTGLTHAVLMQSANIFTREEMNIFYNAADVLAFPTKGEGFGLPSLEAMATKTPVIATRFGPQYELHADGRGLFIDVEDYEPGNASAFTYFARPSWRSLGERLIYAFEHKEEMAEMAERAYQWVQPHTWDAKAQQMHDVLTEVVNRPEAEKEVVITSQEPRNRAERRRSARKKKHASLI